MTEENKEVTKETTEENNPQKLCGTYAKDYLPATDIVETDEKIALHLDMPGVDKKDISIKLENNVLNVKGQIDTSLFSDLEPLYTEHYANNYSRRFEISSKVDKSNIEAKMEDGVLTLELPKVPELQPKTIQVN